MPPKYEDVLEMSDDNELSSAVSPPPYTATHVDN